MKKYTKEELLDSYLPEEIKTTLIQALEKYFKSHTNRKPFQDDIDSMLWHIYLGSPAYQVVTQYTDNVFGESNKVKFDFWHKVLSEDHDLFFEAIGASRRVEHIINGEKFIV